MVFNQIGEAGNSALEAENGLRFRSLIGRSVGVHSRSCDPGFIEMSGEPLVGPVALELAATVAQETAHPGRPKVMHPRKQIAGAGMFGERPGLVPTRISTAINPMGESIATGATIEAVADPEYFATIGEVEFRECIYAAAGKEVEITSGNLTEPDPRAFS